MTLTINTTTTPPAFAPIFDQLTATREQLTDEIKRLDQIALQATSERDFLFDLLGDLEAALERATGRSNPTPTKVAAPPSAPTNVAPPPAAAAKKPGRPANKKPAKVDYEEIARWIYAAKDNGTYSQAALAERFKVPLSTAKNYVVRCRQLGLKIDPNDTSSTPPALPAAPPADQKVTVAAGRVSVNGSPPVPVKPSRAPLVLACTAPDCGFEVTPDRLSELVRHTGVNHGRRPFPEERTPVPPAGGAAA